MFSRETDPCQRPPATLHGVVFDILVGSEDRGALSPTDPAPRARGQLRQGLRYVRATPELAVPLLMMAAVGCLTYEFQVSLPVMASRGLHVGASGFGFMTAAMGIGAVVGGLLVAARGKTGVRPLVLAASAFGLAMRFLAAGRSAEGK